MAFRKGEKPGAGASGKADLARPERFGKTAGPAREFGFPPERFGKTSGKNRFGNPGKKGDAKPAHGPFQPAHWVPPAPDNPEEHDRTIQRKRELFQLPPTKRKKAQMESAFRMREAHELNLPGLNAEFVQPSIAPDPFQPRLPPEPAKLQIVDTAAGGFPPTESALFPNTTAQQPSAEKTAKTPSKDGKALPSGTDGKTLNTLEECGPHSTKGRADILVETIVDNSISLASPENLLGGDAKLPRPARPPLGKETANPQETTSVDGAHLYVFTNEKNCAYNNWVALRNHPGSIFGIGILPIDR